MKVRSVIFWFAFASVWILLSPIIFFNALFIKSRVLADSIAFTLSKSFMILIRIICNVKYRVIGLENIPKNNCIVACKHQSFWETVCAFSIFGRKVGYVYKKELLYVPIFGSLLKCTSSVCVDRSGGMGAIKKLISGVKASLKAGSSIVIFPQGTRTPPSSVPNNLLYPYQPGIAGMYSSCDSIVLPVALNSGSFCGKSFLIKRSGTITVEILAPINPGLPKNEFMNILQSRIEERSAELYNEARK